jgi:hypothetical protein
MTTGKIFLLNDNGKTLTPMTETGYVTEGDLQTFLADHPDLLPGDQIDPESPRRWLLVAREMGVPGDVDESGRWSLDHLFLDQDGIPTFVECKRSQDTRARREVVAQMLDYAANGLEYWSVDRLRQSATETADKRGISLDQLILDLFDDGDERTVETYWQMVEANLRAGKVRLIFVLDQSTRELRRLVEFLNQKMADVEVLIVEIRQFLGEAQTALVPRVLGITEQARSTKVGSTAGQPRVNKALVFERCSLEAGPLFESIFNASEGRQCQIYWGVVGFSVRAFNSESQRWFTFALGWPNKNELHLYFKDFPASAEELAILRQTAMASNIFKKSGQHTLIAAITDQSREQILNIFNLVLDKVAPI